MKTFFTSKFIVHLFSKNSSIYNLVNFQNGATMFATTEVIGIRTPKYGKPENTSRAKGSLEGSSSQTAQTIVLVCSSQPSNPFFVIWSVRYRADKVLPSVKDNEFHYQYGLERMSNFLRLISGEWPYNECGDTSNIALSNSQSNIATGKPAALEFLGLPSFDSGPQIRGPFRV